MSEHYSALDPRFAEYIAARTAGDDAFLLDLKAAARARGFPPIWIAPAQAALQAILIRATGARRVVEVGTLAGYSAIQMARALPADGKLVTLELDPGHAQFAREWCARSDVAARIEVREGRAGELLRELEASSFDAAFLDADKTNYPEYLEHARRLLRPGGLLLVDNAFAFGQLFAAEPSDREVPAVRAFNERLASDAGFQSVIVPLGDGLWVGVRV